MELSTCSEAIILENWPVYLVISVAILPWTIANLRRVGPRLARFRQSFGPRPLTRPKDRWRSAGWWVTDRDSWGPTLVFGTTKDIKSMMVTARREIPECQRIHASACPRQDPSTHLYGGRPRLHRHPDARRGWD